MSDSEEYEDCDDEEYILPDVTVKAKTLKQNTSVVSQKSLYKYQKTFDHFVNWQEKTNRDSFHEGDLLAYFVELSPSTNSSSLWAKYSMLKSKLRSEKNVDIDKYSQLKAFLKQNHKGYKAKKARCFTKNDVFRFLTEAPDKRYLPSKVALILGIIGACRREELHRITMDNLRIENSIIIVSVPGEKKGPTRTFIVEGEYYNIIEKYVKLRPSRGPANLFLSFRNERCTIQPIGRNKIGSMPKEIATWLKLPKPEEYSGHSFRRTSDTLLTDHEVASGNLKLHMSQSIAKKLINESVNHKRKNSKQTKDDKTCQDDCEEFSPYKMVKVEMAESIEDDNSREPTNCENNTLSIEEVGNISPETPDSLEDAEECDEDNSSNLQPADEQEADKECDILPAKSKAKYKVAYDRFISWRKSKKIKSLAESVLVTYFEELAEKFKPTTLWATYSMLKSYIQAKHKINIHNYSLLMQFLRRNSTGFQSKKAQVLTPEQIKQFIREAPDDQYLAIKVALIFGIQGACRKSELCDLTIDNIEDKGNMVLVKIPDTKTYQPRSFVVTDEFYEVYKKYAKLRPNETDTKRFFLCYHNGKCTRQVIGINTIGTMPKTAATYLKLDNPESYTGHTFRRTSATLLANSGGNVFDIKEHGGWKSNTIAKEYIEKAIESKKIIGKMIASSIFDTPSTSNSHEYNSEYNNVANQGQQLFFKFSD